MAEAGDASIGCGMDEDVRSSLIKTRDQGAGVPIIALGALPERSPIECEVVLAGETESLIVYRDGASVRVWLNICPHAGRRLDWAPGKFLLGKDGHLICAAHGATFEWGQGECIAGPCRGASLRALAVDVVAGEVRVWP
jgi:nitrite reductase/ring-hydroxylating ferredoxin subunit